MVIKMPLFKKGKWNDLDKCRLVALHESLLKVMGKMMHFLMLCIRPAEVTSEISGPDKDA